MAIKGLAYTKTAWAFEERPVASAKLNQWDDRIEAALELLHFLLSQAWGGGDGVVRGASDEDLAVVAHTPADMSVTVMPGYAFIGNTAYRLVAAVDSPVFSAPIANPRIDLVQARLQPWDIGVKQGVESATPSAPAPDANAIVLAQVYLRPGMATIEDADDSTNGYIIDARTFL